MRVEEELLPAAGGAAAVGRGAAGDRGAFGVTRRILADGLGRHGEDSEDEGQVSHGDNFGLRYEWELEDFF